MNVIDLIRAFVSRKVHSQRFTRGKPLSVRVESCRRWTLASFGPLAAVAVPGSPQVVRRKTIARQWPPAPTLQTPAPAPAAAEPGTRKSFFVYTITSFLRDSRGRPPRVDRRFN